MTISFADSATIDNMFQAMEDGLQQRIDGTEGYTITAAQLFAGGVLMANDMIHTSVMGTESLFSSIGSGIAKTWEWIKKQFKKIWGFFFKTDGAKAIKEAREEIDDAIKAVDALPEEAFEPVKQESASAKKRKAAEENKARNLVDKTVEVATKLDKTKEYAKKNAEHLDNQIARAKEAELKAQEEMLVELKKEGDRLAERLSSVDTYLDRAKKFKGGHLPKKDIKEFLKKMQYFLDALEEHTKGISKLSSKVEKMISDAESVMKRTKAGGDEEIKKTVSLLKAILQSANGSVSVVSQNVNAIKSAANDATSTYEFVYAA